MSKDMVEFFIFTVFIDGQERIAMHPKDQSPLVYMNKEGIEKDNIRQYVQHVADNHGVNFKLKHFKLVEVIETIDSMKTRTIQ